MAASIDLTRTLDQLEGCEWGEPNHDSYVVSTCHALRRKPLAALTDEEVRAGIGQSIGLPYLVPLAFKRLEADPLPAASLYDGDLLRSVLDVPSAFWSEHPDLRDQFRSVVRWAVALGADLGGTAWVRSRQGKT
jgi:hypothetical protein